MELVTESPKMQMSESVNSITAAASVQPTGQRITLLAIDDRTDFLQLLKDLLEPCGFDVHTAANPVKALELFQHNKDKYKLVLLDYYMPQLDGGKTFGWLRKINPNVKVIVCSGADELRLRQIQMEHKIDAYIHKPFRVKDALDTINRVLNRPINCTN